MWRIFLVLLCLTPFSLEAATVRVVPNVLPMRVGTPVTLTLYVDVTDEVVNAVEASFVFDKKLDFVDASDNDSSVLFWVRYPSSCAATAVCLSGIAPGGFTGTSHLIASLTFIPNESGTTTVSFDSIQVLKHDGKGSPTLVLAESAYYYVEDALPGSIAPVTYTDTEPPEAFTSEIVSDPQVHDGAFVLIFETKDKQTKVAAYYVKEYSHPWLGWFASWQLAESPFKLKDQTLQSYVAVRAIDEAGNERTMVVQPKNPISAPPPYGIVSTALLLIIVGIVIYRYRRYRKAST